MRDDDKMSDNGLNKKRVGVGKQGVVDDWAYLLGF